MANQNEEWHPYKVETDGVPMVDAGMGKPFILRTFEFSISPANLKKIETEGITLDKQQIFNTHWPQIRTILWSDGIVASTDVDPRVVIGKKRYRIFLLCEPRFRVMVADKPTTLQDVFKKKNKNLTK